MRSFQSLLERALRMPCRAGGSSATALGVPAPLPLAPLLAAFGPSPEAPRRLRPCGMAPPARAPPETPIRNPSLSAAAPPPPPPPGEELALPLLPPPPLPLPPPPPPALEPAPPVPPFAAGSGGRDPPPADTLPDMTGGDAHSQSSRTVFALLSGSFHRSWRKVPAPPLPAASRRRLSAQKPRFPSVRVSIEPSSRKAPSVWNRRSKSSFAGTVGKGLPPARTIQSSVWPATLVRAAACLLWAHASRALSMRVSVTLSRSSPRTRSAEAPRKLPSPQRFMRAVTSLSTSGSSFFPRNLAISPQRVRAVRER
mmetsp:Transcript_10313/g.33804  ORF Transcript_10313/g.33804 Transcript_10313/m.33804 type:complete len:311 (-) Transcript_10313:588-1520(-)